MPENPELKKLREERWATSASFANEAPPLPPAGDTVPLPPSVDDPQVVELPSDNSVLLPPAPPLATTETDLCALD